MSRKHGRELEWHERFLQSPQLLTIDERIEKVVPTLAEKRDLVVSMLKRRVIEACYIASHYDKSDDPNHQMREKVRHYNEDKPRLHGYIGKIRDFLNAHPENANHLAGYVISRMRLNGVQISGLSRPEDYLFSMLDSLSAGLLESRYGAPFGPLMYMHNTTHGCILVDRQFGRSQLPEVTTMLMFNLAVVIRKASMGQYFLSNGERMPQGGSQHDDLIADLVWAAFGGEIYADEVSQRLRSFLKRNPSASLVQWPETKSA